MNSNRTLKTILSSLIALLFVACDYDIDAPVVKSLSSVDNIEIDNQYAPILFLASDNKLGVHPESLKVLINNTEMSNLASINKNIILIQPTIEYPLPSGNFTISITLSDIIENSATTNFDYIGTYANDALQILPKSEKIADSSSISTKYSVYSKNEEDIVLFEWDFDNDGRFDYSDIATGDIVHEGYSKSSTLRVTDSSGETTTISITTK